jgi:hypothetical protein
MPHRSVAALIGKRYKIFPSAILTKLALLNILRTLMDSIKIKKALAMGMLLSSNTAFQKNPKVNVFKHYPSIFEVNDKMTPAINVNN